MYHWSKIILTNYHDHPIYSVRREAVFQFDGDGYDWWRSMFSDPLEAASNTSEEFVSCVGFMFSSDMRVHVQIKGYRKNGGLYVYYLLFYRKGFSICLTDGETCFLMHLFQMRHVWIVCQSLRLCAFIWDEGTHYCTYIGVWEVNAWMLHTQNGLAMVQTNGKIIFPILSF